jgi:cytochrome o ubiquinol oxidase operon protein cyoD
MSHESSLITDHAKPSATLPTYVVGFVLSVALTLLAYTMVTHHTLTGQAIIYGLMILASAQLIVQLVFFLHVGQRDDGHWNLVFLLTSVGIILMVVVGSIWIMSHLNYQMMPSMNINQQIIKDEGIQP